jgi:hypothetical protein
MPIILSNYLGSKGRRIEILGWLRQKPETLFKSKLMYKGLGEWLKL